MTKIDRNRPSDIRCLAALNFFRVCQTLRATPATKAGIGDHVWEIEEIVALLDKEEKFMDYPRWEDFGEWLEPPRTDGLPRAFRYFDTPDELKGKKVYVAPGFTIPGTRILDSHENINARCGKPDK
jgi:hypothetical protein